MRYFWLLGILGIFGCQSIVGPLEYRQPVRVDDPQLPIYLQQRLARSEVGLPQNQWSVGPDIKATPTYLYQFGTQR